MIRREAIKHFIHLCLKNRTKRQGKMDAKAYNSKLN